MSGITLQPFRRDSWPRLAAGWGRLSRLIGRTGRRSATRPDCPGPVPAFGDLVQACREQVALQPGAALGPEAGLQALVRETLAAHLPTCEELPVQRVLDEMVGYGPLGPLMADAAVTEVMVVGADNVWVEHCGALRSTDVRFSGEAALLDLMTRLVGKAGRRLDCAAPYVDARLPDGTRLHAVIPPLAVSGPALTLRKLPAAVLSLPDLVRCGTLGLEMAEFLRLCARAGANMLISGPCGSGKTTLLRAVAGAIAPGERIVSIEEAAELGLSGHVVALQARPAGLEGHGAVSLRDLLRNALRMRPDRLIVGEVRGVEALDLLHAMSVGHACMSTLHAASAQEALGRLEGLALLGVQGLPLAAIRAQLGRAIEVVVHQERLPDGGRRAVEIALVQATPRGPQALPIFTWDPAKGFGRGPSVLLPGGLGRKVARAGLQAPPWLVSAHGGPS